MTAVPLPRHFTTTWSSEVSEVELPAAMNETAIRRGFRPEIQGLRAVAVLLVVAYHLYPNRVSGGYVGVDVFFVLSGYLITSHLLREATTTSRLSLARFWERRIRRLLPASLLVLAVSTGLTLVYVPRSLWEQTLHHIVMSALYIENWALAADAVDYSAMGSEPTLVQHYWSLSVEEQFYLFWPLLVVAALVVVRRRERLALRPVLGAVLIVVTVVSFVYSVFATAEDAAHAYFVTPTRVWEFGIGALVALVGTAPAAWWKDREPVRVVLGWSGVAAVVWSGLVLNDATPFPGWIAAVPVLGAAAVVLAGPGGSPLSVARPLAWRPVTFVGDISYSIYLWHWPFIVVLPFVTGVALRTVDKAGIFVVTIVVSWACTRWVEDPVRKMSSGRDVQWRSYGLAAAGMVVIVAATSLMNLDYERDVRAAKASSEKAIDEALAGRQSCLGPAVFDDAQECGPVSGDGDPPLDTAAVAHQNIESAYPDCMAGFEDPKVLICELGAREDVQRTVAVVGDSHGTAWFGAFDALGRERHWKVLTFTRASCPFTDARRVLPDEPAAYYRVCRAHNQEVERRLIDDPKIDSVFVTAYSSAYTWAQAPGSDFADPEIDGFRSVWSRLVDADKQVFVIRDVPSVRDRIETPICLDRNALEALACSTTRADGLRRDVEAEAVNGAADAVRLIDLTDRFCDSGSCYAVIGDVIVYRDGSHLSDDYSTLLAPYLGLALDAVDQSRQP